MNNHIDRAKVFLTKHWKALALVAVPILLLILTLSFSSDDPPEIQQTHTTMEPVYSAHDFADRVFYSGDGSREWGTLCRYGDGYISANHVTMNGTPVVGPKTPVTHNNEADDWSMLGLELEDLDGTQLSPGVIGFIAGFPAVDRDGELIPAKVYMTDNNPAHLWLELTEWENGLPPEGVVGGVSGSCFIVDGKPEAVVIANGFSKIDGTTNTWALAVPVFVIQQQLAGETVTKPMGLLSLPLPTKETF